ncbi:exo-beta-1,3-glucanase, variant 4 [Coprinopsis cinerea AmutBmut pab1-1]|nr:exo-beta-1,3-glucanase, variant 4 [Coprinopsis cinerea AmutBmut pab1-1]
MPGVYKSVTSSDEFELVKPRGSRETVHEPEEVIDMYAAADGSPHHVPYSFSPPDSGDRALPEESTTSMGPGKPMKKGVKISIAVAVLIAVITIAIAVPLAVTVGKSKNGTSSSGGGAGGGSSGGGSATSGKSGSLVTMEDGSTFTYVNEFGGDWAADPARPFGSGGKAQEWSPRVGVEEWKWGEHVIRGVNLGGWLVTEPFICPELYERFIENDENVTVVDEWTLSLAMGDRLPEEMENHYKTFITEQDFAEIAAAGLNWIRVPIGYWAIETMGEEPFLVGTSWTYFLKAIQWARKYGLRIYLDLHALPGSQNGWNHSGKAGTVNFMHGTMGIANAQRTLTYLRIFTQFVSQPQYKDVVPIVGIVNEILWDTIGEEAVQSFYYAAYEAMRGASGIGEGNGPYIAIHEGFQGPAIWEGFLLGSDRVVLDQHPYLAFMGDPNSTPESSAPRPCEWAIATNQSQQVFGVTVGGEFSTAINNCGLWFVLGTLSRLLDSHEIVLRLNGVDGAPIPGCELWDDWNSWNSTIISGLKQVTLASMDALQHFFFWTWKIGNSTRLGTSSSPMWHYKLGLERGWIPKDPREAIGHCAEVLGTSQLFDGRYPSTATGGAAAGTLDPTRASAHPFPPATISPSFSGDLLSLLPTYTPTGTLQTLFAPTFTAAPSAVVGTGWNNPDDNSPAYVPVAGCSYPDAWDAVDVPLSEPFCTGS